MLESWRVEYFAVSLCSHYNVFGSECGSLLGFCLCPSDSDSSLLRFLSDDRILLIQEEAEFSQRDTSRRSRKKSRNPSSPSFPISPSMLAPPVRLDTGPPEGLPFPVPDSNTMPHYHVSEMSKWDRSELGLFSHNCNCLMSVNVDLFFKYERFHLEAYQTIWHWYLFIKKKFNSLI